MNVNNIQIYCLFLLLLHFQVKSSYFREMVTEMSTKSNGGVPFFSHVHTTPYPISAQNFTIGKYSIFNFCCSNLKNVTVF